MQIAHHNIDAKTVEGFGREWSTFHSISNQEAIFEDYFRIFPWHLIDKNSVGLDFGCGTGRWAYAVAPRVKKLWAIDASQKSVKIASQNLKKYENAVTVWSSWVPEQLLGRMDFAYSLGVLHHVPDTQAAINDIARALKPGAPFLIYLYYAFDNKPKWYKWLWQISNLGRLFISRLPYAIQLVLTTIIATLLYFPLSRLGWIFPGMPLAYYRDKSFYVMRTDAFDRFCTRLEKRFTRVQIATMLHNAGFEKVSFSAHQPWWCAVAFKK